jgi:hypothetical protein
MVVQRVRCDIEGVLQLGGAVGSLFDEITGLSITRDGEDDVGLLGATGSDATLTNVALTNVDVTGSGSVGGLVGYNFNTATVEKSYATGSVSSASRVGGLVGFNRDNADVEQSYWDRESTGQDSGAGGTGLSTSEMQGASAADEMTDLDFSAVWATVTDPDDYPVLRALDRATQLDAR